MIVVIDTDTGDQWIRDRGESEASIEAYLIGELWQQGIAAYSQPTVEMVREGWSFKPDVVTVGDGRIQQLIEVKRTDRIGREQAAKYDATALPWRVCSGIADIPDTITWAGGTALVRVVPRRF